MTGRETPWARFVNDGLADGEWHDGLPLMREAMKKIPPGIALRTAEAARDAKSPPLDEEGNPRQRRFDRTKSELINAGKISIMQSVLHARRRVGTWETDPATMPRNAWLIGGWKLRDLNVHRRPLTSVARQLGCNVAKAKELLLQDPPLAHRGTGRTISIEIHEVDQLRERVEQWRAGGPQRRSAASKLAAQLRASSPPDLFSVAALATRSRLAPATARALSQEHPELPWQTRAHGTFLHKDHLPEWEKIVAEYQAQAWSRRSQAMKAARMHRILRQAGTPNFEDPALTASYAQYVAGDTELRDQVYQDMREAFHRADTHDTEGGGEAP